MLHYAINYTKVPEGIQANFLDFPGLSATAPDADTILDAAYSTLIDKLMNYMEAGVPVPLPEVEPDQFYVALLPSIVAKVLLHNMAVEQHRSRSWIASQMGVTRQVMTRLFNLRETTKVETIQNALDALGYEMNITIEPRART